MTRTAELSSPDTAPANLPDVRGASVAHSEASNGVVRAGHLSEQDSHSVAHPVETVEGDVIENDVRASVGDPGQSLHLPSQVEIHMGRPVGNVVETRSSDAITSGPGTDLVLFDQPRKSELPAAEKNQPGTDVATIESPESPNQEWPKTIGKKTWKTTNHGSHKKGKDTKDIVADRDDEAAADPDPVEPSADDLPEAVTDPVAAKSVIKERWDNLASRGSNLAARANVRFNEAMSTKTARRLGVVALAAALVGGAAGLIAYFSSEDAHAVGGSVSDSLSSHTGLTGPEPAPGIDGLDSVLREAEQVGHPVVDETISGDHSDVWGTFEDLYGKANTKSTILERVETLQANGWDVQFHNDPRTDDLWWIESIKSPDGTEYEGLGRQVGALEYAKDLDNVPSAPSFTEVQPDNHDSRVVEFSDEGTDSHDSRVVESANVNTSTDGHDSRIVESVNDGANVDNHDSRIVESANDGTGVEVTTEPVVVSQQATTTDAKGVVAQSAFRPPLTAADLSDPVFGRTPYVVAGGAAAGSAVTLAAMGANSIRKRRNNKQNGESEQVEGTETDQEDAEVEQEEPFLFEFLERNTNETNKGWISFDDILKGWEAEQGHKLSDEEIGKLKIELSQVAAAGYIHSNSQSGEEVYSLR